MSKYNPVVEKKYLFSSGPECSSHYYYWYRKIDLRESFFSHLSSSNEKSKTGERFSLHFSSNNGFSILYEGFCLLPLHFFIGTEKIEIADLFFGFHKSFTFASLHFSNGQIFEVVGHALSFFLQNVYNQPPHFSIGTQNCQNAETFLRKMGRKHGENSTVLVNAKLPKTLIFQGFSTLEVPNSTGDSESEWPPCV